jgi:hypothetical protein
MSGTYIKSLIAVSLPIGAVKFKYNLAEEKTLSNGSNRSDELHCKYCGQLSKLTYELAINRGVQRQ